MVTPDGTDALDLTQVMRAALIAEGPGEYLQVWEQAHHDFLKRGRVQAAARCAIWLSMALFDRGEHARAGGWAARAKRLLEDGHLDCVEQGYLLGPKSMQAFAECRFDEAIAIADQAIGIANRFHDPDLVVLARHHQGRAWIRAGQIAKGLELLDEVMTSVTSGETSPNVTGLVYCSVIDACDEILECQRMQEWTVALDKWLQTQPDRVPFRGRCLLHRVQILQLHGHWPDAMQEALLALDYLSAPPPHPLVGEAHYRQGELHRMRGEVREAEGAYAAASAAGRDPQPGLALLRLGEGRVEVAKATVRTLIDQDRDLATRARILDACVDVMLAAGDVRTAREIAEELKRIAAGPNLLYLRALAGRAAGAALVADGDAKAAVPVLREAQSAWRDLDAPYESARVRLLIGLAYHQLGDEDSAVMEIDAARRTFERLGAATDLARLEKLSQSGPARPAGGLSGREVEVLALVATGKTNREIATVLSISEKTVARHVSNIFTKLDLTSRAAATAYAFKHGLV